MSHNLRSRVEKLEAGLQSLPQVDCSVRHHFAPGVYAREISIPKGTVITGAVHKRQNLAILSKGVIVLATEDGPVTIIAPHTLTVSPGGKTAVVALEDSVWTNFFATDETDPDKLVEILTESTADQLIGGPKNVQLLQSGPQLVEV